MKVAIPGFKEADIKTTVVSKQTRVDGESFIVDWGDSAYAKYKEDFIRATESMRRLFGACFVMQRNHHSTIVSKRLDPSDRPSGITPPKWIDLSLSSCRKIFAQHLRNFELELQLCVLASGGTIQLVYRDETVMPRIRQDLMNLGAEVKPGTLDGDRMNTCTVVLGYLTRVPEHDIDANDVTAAISVPPKIKVTRASLVEYSDTSLNDYDTLERFESA
jgi:hypothetical protein